MLSLDIFARWATLSNVVAWKPNSTKSSRAASMMVWPSASLAGRPRRPWLFSVTAIPVLDSILILELRYHTVSEMCKPMRRFQFVHATTIPAEVGCAFHHRSRPRSGRRQARPVSLHPQHGAHHHG